MTRNGPTTTTHADLAVEERAIREADQRLLRAAQARDPVAFAALFAPNGQLLFPNYPAAVGPGAIRENVERMFSAPGFSVSWTAAEYIISESGDLAASIGTYDLVLVLPEGRVEDHGKFLTLWRKADGGWLIAADMINTDTPLPGPADEV